MGVAVGRGAVAGLGVELGVIVCGVVGGRRRGGGGGGVGEFVAEACAGGGGGGLLLLLGGLEGGVFGTEEGGFAV